MSVNVQKLAERLRQFEEGAKSSEFSRLLWKPKEGIQTVRVVPYKFNPESPFIELKFYYKLAGKNYLAPCTFGKPDPILEAIEDLRASGSNEEREIAAKLSPVARTYAPVIVRGEEQLGVRYWGFGVQVYKQLLTLMTNPKWGDITSWTEGNDLDVEFRKESKKKNAKGQSFPETIITPDPSKRPVVDPSRKDIKELMEKLKNQTDILKIFPLKTYDELKEVLTKWLDPSAGEPIPAPDEGEEINPSVTPEESPSSATPVQSGALANEFDKFFQS